MEIRKCLKIRGFCIVNLRWWRCWKKLRGAPENFFHRAVERQTPCFLAESRLLFFLSSPTRWRDKVGPRLIPGIALIATKSWAFILLDVWVLKTWRPLAVGTSIMVHAQSKCHVHFPQACFWYVSGRRAGIAKRKGVRVDRKKWSKHRKEWNRIMNELTLAHWGA